MPPHQEARMVDRACLRERPAPPPVWKRMFDQHVVPAAIDLAGGAERSVLRGLDLSRRRPALAALCVLAGIVCLPLLRRGARA
jgi:hypothetical protein